MQALSGSTLCRGGDQDKGNALSGPRYVQPEIQWHPVFVEFAADAVIPTPEFKGATIAQPTDGNPALSKRLGVICRYDVFLTRDVLTWGQDIALIPRHH
jgi:hypothetical protein